MLRTARLYSSFTEEPKSAVTNIALRGRDRMDTSFIAECNAEPVQRIIQSMEFLVHTLVPEIFCKEYSLNKPGMLEHPLSVCTGNFGTLYTTDYTFGILFKVKLHDPADVQTVAKDFSSPTCVIYKSGVVFVAEKSCLSYLDVGDVVTLNPKAMKKKRLHKEVLNHNLLQPGERATVAQMRQLLSEWIEENSPDTSRENGLKILIDEISPLALAADNDRDEIYVSQRDSIVILKVTLTFTGTKLKGDVKPFITMPERHVVQDWFTAKNPIISSWPTLRKMKESTLLTLLWQMRSQRMLSE